MEDCVMWSMVGTKVYKKCAQVYKLEERIKELEDENEKLRKIIEEAISQHHRVAPNTVMDGVVRKYEALKGGD